MKQRDRVIRHLMDWGSLTALEALREYGIMHLARRRQPQRGLPVSPKGETADGSNQRFEARHRRIDELRKDGWPIQTVPIKSTNRYGEKTTYAKYVLIRALCKPGQAAEGRARRQKR